MAEYFRRQPPLTATTSALARWRQRLLISMALSCCLTAVGCKRQRPRKLLPAAIPPPPADSATEGELGAGRETAFGFVLPRGLRVTARMRDTVYAKGRVGFEAAKRYLREQLVDSHAEESKNRLVLSHATVAQHPDDKLRFVLSQTGNGVTLVIRVKTHHEAEPGLSEAERWKRAGLTPDGEVIENEAR